MRRINLFITLFLLAVLFVYLAFLDDLAKPIFEQQASEQYGAEVSIDRVTLSPFVGKATLYNLQVADRRDPMRNLSQAERVYVDINMRKLAESVIEISDMEVEGLVMFAPRQTPAKILRPLLPEDSGLARAGLPDFSIPDVDSLFDKQRDALKADIDALEREFAEREEKWRQKIKSVPNKDDITAYKARIKTLKDAEGPLQKLAAVKEVQVIYNEVNQEIAKMRNMQQEFRGDLQELREQVEIASQLPKKYTNALTQSLGLTSEQVAQIGSTILRGDLDGLLQQVLAPLAYSAEGEIDPAETIPIHIRRAHVSGSLLPSAAGLSASGELTDFSWPLENADQVARLLVTGNSIAGGVLAIDASVDHRGEPDDRVTVAIDRLPLRDMSLSGMQGLHIELLQTLVAISGELSVSGNKLDGNFTQQFTDAVFETALAENAGRSSQIIARVLEATSSYFMQIGFAGTLESPRLNFRSDLDALIQSTVEGVIQEAVTSLTAELQNRLSAEIGPEIAAARQQFGALETLQAELRQSLGELDAITR